LAAHLALLVHCGTRPAFASPLSFSGASPAPVDRMEIAKYGLDAMSIVPLLAQSAFEPETIETLVAVYEAAWRKVEQSGSKFASPGYKRAAQEIIAKRIIEMAQRGERDPGQLADDAVAYLERSYA
jgi:hypothetical protein